MRVDCGPGGRGRSLWHTDEFSNSRVEGGVLWLERLRSVLADLSRRWDLVRLGPAFPGTRASFVAPVVDRNGGDLVLKVSPDVRWAQCEYEALSHWDGRGAVNVVAFDPELGAILEERAQPGAGLRDLPADDEAASHIFAGVAATLRSAGRRESRLPSVASWLAHLELEESDTVPSGLEHHRDAARSLARILLASTTRHTVLHADLHHANLLSNGQHGWVAVDPKGLIGPEEIEPAAFLRNPRGYLLNAADPVAVVTGRTLSISEHLGYQPVRVAGWGYVFSVLAAVWALEDLEGPDEATRWLRCASVLDEARRWFER